jgi:hypothetical protein
MRFVQPVVRREPTLTLIAVLPHTLGNTIDTRGIGNSTRTNNIINDDSRQRDNISRSVNSPLMSPLGRLDHTNVDASRSG